MDDSRPHTARATLIGRGHTAKPSRVWRRIIIGGSMAFVCLFLLAAGARWWLGHFLHGEDFRQFLTRKTSAALQAEAHFEPLHWESSEVYTAGLTVRGSPTGPLSSLDADQVRAAFDLSALWRRAWRVDTLDVERIKAELGSNSGRKNGSPQPRPDQIPAPGADRLPFASLLPNRMEIGEVRVADFSLKWGDGQSSAGQVDDVRLSARMLGNVKTWEVDGQGGMLSQTGLPRIALDEFALKSTEEALFLTRARGRPKPGGKLECSGKQALTGDKALDLVFDLEGVPVDPLLPPDWRGRLRGKTSGRIRLTGSPDDAQSWRSSGHLDLHEGQLEALPVLDQLAVFSASARYRHATVQKGGADFTWSPETLQVRSLVIESEGLLRVEGDFTVRARQIDGYFRVGVAISSVRWVNEVGAAVFDLPQRDGYAWTTMRVTGPVDHPREDLTGRLATSAEKAIINQAKQGSDVVLDTAGSLLDLLKGH